MNEFTAELEQVFGAVPSRETGLLIDTFDGAGLDDTDGAVLMCCSGSSCRVTVPACGTCRVAVPA
ncbi:hypothetical protein [Lentzea albida]|nr:hypothetical protein [Lentzea albida]